jgi:pilus assembly protein CpaB
LEEGRTSLQQQPGTAIWELDGGTAMNGKSLMMLGLAIAFGLCAMFLTKQMMGQEPNKAEETAQDVLVAARDIKEEEMLKPDTVKVIRMAKSAVPVGAFSVPKDVEDRWVKTALLEGDVVIEKKLGAKGTPPGLVANIPKGMRAFAIDVTEQSGVSGFILPGHRVDVIRFESQNGTPRGESILQDIQVLAAGQVFTRVDERSLSIRTVTLAVTPEQVDILVAARATGSLALSLRGVNDHAVVTRPAPPSAPHPAEARLKVEEGKRQKLEQELAELKAAIAARPVATPAAAPTAPARQAARYVTIYRGANRVERVRMDDGAPTEIADSRPERPPGLDALGVGVRPESRAALGAGAGAGAAAGVDIDSLPLLEAAALGPKSGEMDPPGS